MTMILATLLLATAPVAEAPPVQPVEVPLTFRTFRSWDVSLPDERFQPLGERLPLFGTDGLAVEVNERGLAFDRDGDGTMDATVAPPTEDHPTRLLTFQLTTPEGPRAFAVRVANQGRWVFAPAGAVEGRVGTTRFLVFDQDGNGRFDDYGVDAMIVGRGKAAGFLSRTIHVDGTLMDFAITPGGSTATLTPHQGPTGSLDLGTGLETKAKLRSVVLLDAEHGNSFELSGGLDAPVAVPAGSYTLVSGELVLGKSHATIDTGRAAPIEVPVDGRVQVAWGGPVTAEFTYVRQGGQVEVGPADVTYFGRAGERYADFLPLGSSPEFTVKDRVTGEVLVDFVFPGNC